MQTTKVPVAVINTVFTQTYELLQMCSRS